MSITTGVGLISGIDTASLIDQLIALESRPKLFMQARIAALTSQQASLLDINGQWVIANDYRGELQMAFWRLFNLPSLDLQLGSATGAGETVDDNVIA